MFQTEIEFTLPCGFLDQEGELHREGIMRRSTAADEILPLKDPRVVKNPAYLVIILLSRVVLRLGSLSQINPGTVEKLYTTDLAYLQNLYNELNQLDETGEIGICPKCQEEMEMSRPTTGELLATPSNNS